MDSHSESEWTQVFIEEFWCWLAGSSGRQFAPLRVGSFDGDLPALHGYCWDRALETNPTKIFTKSWSQWCHGIVTSIWLTAGWKEKAVTIHWGISMYTKNYVLQSGYKSPNTTYVLRPLAIWMLKLYDWTHSCTHESPFSLNSLGLQWVPIRSLKVIYSDMQSDSEDPWRLIFHSSTFIND